MQDGIPLTQATGGTGSGTMYVHAAPGIHRLQIETGCTWTVTVNDGDTLPRADVLP